MAVTTAVAALAPTPVNSPASTSAAVSPDVPTGAQEGIGTNVRRSSSHTSGRSVRSKRPHNHPRRTASSRHPSKVKQRHSTPASTEPTTTDLTFFATFPVEGEQTAPEGFRGEPALSNALSDALIAEGGQRGKTKATLAGLTDVGDSHNGGGRPALFDDSVSIRDVPGSLHLATDDHIERMIARTGAVKLIRQLARDLALRDAEISALKMRTDQRERELKKMLRELAVSSRAIEHRLYLLENGRTGPGSDGTEKHSSPGASGLQQSRIDRMMQEAMSTVAGEGNYVRATMTDAYDSAAKPLSSCQPSPTQLQTARSSSSITRLGQLIWGGKSPALENRMDQVNAESSSNEENSTLESLSHAVVSAPEAAPPSTAACAAVTPGSDDGGQTRPKDSKRSWTNLFGGGFASTTGRTPSREPACKPTPQSQSNAIKTSADDHPKQSVVQDSAAAKVEGEDTPTFAALRRMTGGVGVRPLSYRPKKQSAVVASRHSATRTSTVSPAKSSLIHQTNAERIKNVNVRNADLEPSAPPLEPRVTSHGLVEMDAILPLELRPPALNPYYKPQHPSGLLIDRFGFIYDQKRRTRRRISERLGSDPSYGSSSGDSTQRTSSGIRHCDGLELDKPAISPGKSRAQDNPPCPATPERRWEDYLETASLSAGPTELLSHTPAPNHAGSSSSGAQEPSFQVRQLATDGVSHVSLVAGHSKPATLPALSSTGTAATSQAIAQGYVKPLALPMSANNEPARSLLRRLVDLHESLQGVRTTQWNEFLRKIRAERHRDHEAAVAVPSAQMSKSSSVVTPEALLMDGEVIGVASLGNKGKLGRAKWQEFRRLVLGGIPVTYRAKIWSECSGATALRSPGMYDEYVKTSANADADASVVAQVETDITRTLPDNVFFRSGPGVQRLKEVLLAYARRNPDIGYCQGMNLIAGSLLLMMPTAEDAFWVFTTLIENILPPHYYDHGFLASRADQQVLRQYVSEALPALSTHLDKLGVELETMTFQWFLTAFTDCLSAEALYRVWDVLLCLGPSSSPMTQASQTQTQSKERPDAPFDTPVTTPQPSHNRSAGDGSAFFFQVAVALLKLNEQHLITTCHTPAAVYTYINQQMTNHAISIDGLVQASEALRTIVTWEDVAARRAAAIEDLRAHSDVSRNTAT
ncbi:hypothetical protein KEM52_000009 [Ascosphaera acerosa]|nr:hypothetical protein KEM52_000009 [Ascosphaera acerosa]